MHYYSYPESSLMMTSILAGPLTSWSFSMKCLWIVSSVISFRSVLALNPNVILACLKRLNALKHWAAETYRAKKSIELLPRTEPKSWNPRHSDVVDYHLAFPDHLRRQLCQLCIFPVTLYIFPTNSIKTIAFVTVINPEHLLDALASLRPIIKIKWFTFSRLLQ